MSSWCFACGMVYPESAPGPLHNLSGPFLSVVMCRLKAKAPQALSRENHWRIAKPQSPSWKRFCEGRMKTGVSPNCTRTWRAPPEVLNWQGFSGPPNCSPQLGGHTNILDRLPVRQGVHPPRSRITAARRLSLRRLSAFRQALYWLRPIRAKIPAAKKPRPQTPLMPAWRKLSLPALPIATPN